MAALKLSLLGPCLAALNEKPINPFPTSKVQALLIYLAVERQTAHRREHLMKLLWPGMPLESAQVNLRQTLYRLRKTIPEVSNQVGDRLIPLVLADRQTVQLNPEADLQLDVAAFQAQIDQDPTLADTHYRGDFLTDFYLVDSSEFEAWAEGWRQNLRRRFLETLFDLAEEAISAGDYSQAQTHAWRQLEFEYLRESAYRQLMISLAQGGQRNAALAQYQVCRQRLASELGLEPSPETTALYEQIQADALKATKEPPTPRQPKPGDMPVFLLTDIEGSTRMWDTYRQAMLPALLQHNAILEEQITRHGGVILELRGDGVKAVFEGVNPLQCVLDIQQALGAADWGELGELRIRMGLHGVPPVRKDFDYFIEDDKYYGPVLNHTSRIMDAGHGGQILVSEPVHNAFALPLGARWQDFGTHPVKSLDQPLQIYGLLHPDLPHQAFPPLRTGSDLEKHVQTDHPVLDKRTLETAVVEIPRHNLPAQPTPFIGREKELAELKALITDTVTRLITILGPGGMGKTRLALATADRTLESEKFPDGVFFTDLTHLNEAKQIPFAIAEVLEIELTSSGHEPGAQLVDFLSDKAMLLILDNVEHLFDGARLLAEIGMAAPDIQLLVTSRQRLGLRGEQVYSITGLDFTDWITLDEATGYSAVQLFAGAARRASAEFELTEEDLPHLTWLCQLVGGMPLALELAASWVELLPISKITYEIERGLGLLETDLQDVPDRHRSVQAVFESSWAKLEPVEQDLLQKLSVFRGGFTLEAAQNVANQHGGMAATLKLLARLVSKSLLQSDPTLERYQLHELLRQYAYEHLDGSGDLEATLKAHAAYFLHLLQRQEVVIRSFFGKQSIDPLKSIDFIETEFANIRTAWELALARGNIEDIDRAIFSLAFFGVFRHRELEVLELLSLALKHFAFGENPLDNPIWRQTYGLRSAMVGFSGDSDVHRLLDTLKKIIVEERKEGDKSRLALALQQMGIAEARFDLQAGLPYLLESLAIYRELKDTFFELGLLDIISWLYQIHGNTEKRVEYTNQRLELAQKTGYHMNVADATAILGFADEMAGRYAAAESKYEQALPVYQEYDDRYHYAEYLSQLAGLVLLKGELTRARELIEEAEFLARQMSSPVVQNVPYGTLGMIHNLEEDYAEAIRQTNKIPDALTTQSFVFYRPKGLAYAQCGLGDFSSAQRYLSEAFETAVKTKATGWQVQCLPAAALISASEDQLERATELLSLAYHHPVGETGWLEKFPLVTHLRERLERELSPAAFQESWNHGRRLSHSETVAALKDELAGMGWGLPAGVQQKIRHNLPVQRTSFIGRVAEIERVTSLLGQASLVTLTGVGGTGKTRLALQAVSDVLEDYPNGTWFVELAQLADPAMVPKTVAKTLGLVETPGKPIADTVVDFLESRAVLLVLDNCEHLLGSCASLVDRVLNDCPRITVLATSREILGVIGEVPFLVPPLSMPEDHTDLSFDTLCDCDAVTLFVERARVVTPDFDLSDENAAVIFEVVRRLDGIPLAIELAAARLRLLGVEQIAQRLNDAFRLLTGGSRTALPRQQTLRASIDWSYNLFSEPERILLRRLSVFAGSWSLGAAEEVCADEPGSEQAIQPEDVLDLLSELVDKSLISSVSSAEGRNRFHMLETIRQYAHEKLVDEKEAEALRTRHLGYYLELAETLEPKLRGGEQVETLDRLGRELDNIRLALEWGLQTNVEAQLQLAAALMWFWHIRFHWSECIDWLEKGIELELATRPAPTTGEEFPQTRRALIRAKALLPLGFLRNLQFDYLKARPVLEESLGIYRQAGVQDNRDMAYALLFLGGALHTELRAEESGIRAYASEIRAYADEALGIFRRINHNHGIFECLHILGRLENPVRAGEIYQEALAIVEAIGDVDGIANALLGIGLAAFENGDYAKSQSAYEASREQSRLVNNRFQEGGCNFWMGSTSHLLGDFQRADRYFNESLAIAIEIGNEYQKMGAPYFICMLRIAEGQYAQADEITSEMWGYYQKTGRNYIVMRVLYLRARLARLRGDTFQARKYAQEGLAFTADIFNYQKTLTLLELGHLTLQDGDLKGASKLWREGIRISKSNNFWWWLNLSLDAMAVLALREGKPARAVRLFGTRWSRGAYYFLSPDERTQRDADLEVLREALGDARFEGLYAEGQTMSLEDAVAYALEENDG